MKKFIFVSVFHSLLCLHDHKCIRNQCLHHNQNIKLPSNCGWILLKCFKFHLDLKLYLSNLVMKLMNGETSIMRKIILFLSFLHGKSSQVSSWRSCNTLTRDKKKTLLKKIMMKRNNFFATRCECGRIFELAIISTKTTGNVELDFSSSFEQF